MRLEHTCDLTTLLGVRWCFHCQLQAMKMRLSNLQLAVLVQERELKFGLILQMEQALLFLLMLRQIMVILHWLH